MHSSDGAAEEFGGSFSDSFRVAEVDKHEMICGRLVC